MVKVAEFNGVEIFYLKTDKFKTGSVSISFCDALNKERAYKNALIPAILNRGCVSTPSAREISLKLQNMYGASIGWNIDKRGEIQLIQFMMDFIDEKYAGNFKNIFSEVFKLFIEIITNPIIEENGFKKDYFSQENLNLQNLIKSRINDKASYAHQRCQEEMCKDEPFGTYEYGNENDGETITASELYKYFTQEFLRKIPVKIFYCGRKEPQELIEAVKSIDYFGNASNSRKTLKTGFIKKVPTKVKNVSDQFDVNQGKLSLGFRTNIAAGTDDYYSLAVSNGVLGMGVPSKLFQNVREKNSLAYYASSSLEKYKGLLIASSGIEIVNKDKALELMLLQLDEIKKGNITQYEYESTIKAFETGVNSYKDSQFSMIAFYIGQNLVGDTRDIDGFIDRIKKVTVSDAVEAAQGICLDTIYFLTSKSMQEGKI